MKILQIEKKIKNNIFMKKKIMNKTKNNKSLNKIPIMKMQRFQLNHIIQKMNKKRLNKGYQRTKRS